MSAGMTAGWAPPSDDDRELITASGQVECTECGHVIENHPQGCELCTCAVRWSPADLADYRRWLGLPATAE